MTLHDPCNLVRHGGISEPQRAILRRGVARLRRDDAQPRRELLLRRRGRAAGDGALQATGASQAGGIKAEQIRRTGAKTVVAPCHNCIDQLMELNKEYKLGVAIKTVAEMVADALVLRPRLRR